MAPVNNTVGRVVNCWSGCGAAPRSTLLSQAGLKLRLPRGEASGAEGGEQSKPGGVMMPAACRAICKAVGAVRKPVEAVGSLLGVLVCLGLRSHAQSNLKPQPHEPASQSISPDESWQYSLT